MNHITVNNEKVFPSKIICIARNYLEHIAELKNAIPEEMVVFNKPNSAISEKLHAFHLGEQLHYESEICFVIKDNSLSAVGFGLDITKRETQSRLKPKGLPWERAKAFDGSALFSKFVPFTRDQELIIELTINGKRRQYGSTRQMLHTPLAMLKEVQSFTSLCDGDILMTGTPMGVGPILEGDIFHGTINQSDRELASINWTVLP